MKKEFVNYNQALKLKALGFDEPCFAAYSEDDHVGNLFIYWNDLADMSELFISQDNCEKFNYECLAPTYSQAFRWFREKYGMIFTLIASTYYYPSVSFINTDGNSEIELGEFETYEEAELACLNKLIELTFKSEL